LAQSTDAPIKPTTRNGHPALLLPLDVRGFEYNAVEWGDSEADPALLFTIVHGVFHQCRATLAVSPSTVSVRANEPGCTKYEVSGSVSTFGLDVKEKFNDWALRFFVIRSGKYKEEWLIDADKSASNLKADWIQTGQRSDGRFLAEELLLMAIRDFSGAERQFWDWHGDVMRPEDKAKFSSQAAAWRAMAVKSELPEETRKQRLLAESYLRDKDFNGSIEHYKLGVKACLTWPEGWYNLAALYAETGEYASAVASMKNYLELMPNSSDAAAARDKIVVWEDRASQPRSQQ
jgi:hypothetical protein